LTTFEEVPQGIKILDFLRSMRRKR